MDLKTKKWENISLKSSKGYPLPRMSLDVRMLQINRDEICIFDKEHVLFFNPKTEKVDHMEFKPFFSSGSHYNSQKIN